MMTSKATITVPSHVKIDIFSPLLCLLPTFKIHSYLHLSRKGFQVLLIGNSIFKFWGMALCTEFPWELFIFLRNASIFISHGFCELLLADFFSAKTVKKKWLSYHLLLGEFLNKLLLQGLYQITEIKACSVARARLFLFILFMANYFGLLAKNSVHKLIPRSSTDVRAQPTKNGTSQLCQKIL